MTATVDTAPAPAATEPRRGRAAALVERAHLPLAGALTAFLAFRAGGFFPDATALAALVLIVALVLRVTVSADPFAGWSRPAAIAAAGGVGLAALTLVSAAWSDAPGRALVEFDRALLYVLALVFYATVPRRAGRLSALLRWVLLAFTAAAVAGLASRLAPELFPISGRYIAERLSFPLTYWNATGMVGALGIVLALHHASGAREPAWMRVAATGALPALATTLYFTFSRGAIVAGALGVVVYVVLAHPRRLLCTAVAALPATALALAAAYGAGALATGAYFEPPGPAEGRDVAVAVAAACAGAAVLRAALLGLERRLDGVVIRRRRVLLAGAGVAAVLLAGGAAAVLDAPERVRDEYAAFRDGDFVPETGDARDRLTQRGNNGRLAVWGVALDTFADQPGLGAGAGTFRLEWERRRDVDLTVTDGHSLYLEVLAELGIPGLVLLAAMLGVPLGVAVTRLGGRRRHDHAVFLAAGAALLVHAGVDWDWEMPAVFLWFPAAAGMVLAAPAGSGRVGPPARLARVLAGLACLLVAVTPLLVLRSEAALDGTTGAFRRGDCTTAIDQALAARDALGVRAEPFEVLGYCDLRLGAEPLAVRAMQAARERDPGNWRYAYGLAIARALAGEDPRAAAALAARLNPLEPVATDLERRLRGAPERRWPQIAAGASLPPG